MIRVMLVEDDPMVAELNRLYVNKVDDFTVVAAAASGGEAMRVLETQPVDLILLDVFMPGPNGMDLLAGIRAADLEVDVIFVTAARDTKTISRALKLGAVDYLIKPFEFERMKQALEQYRATHRLMQEAQPASQADLDRVILRPALATKAPESLPKGLDRHTLDRIWTALQAWPLGSGFTSEEVAHQVGLTRVSVRKYLEFLHSLQVLRMEPSYGPVGRPVHRYALLAKDAETLRLLR